MERVLQPKTGAIAAFTAVAIALVLSLGLGARPAYAVTAAEVEAEAQEVLVQINAMQETLDEYANLYYQYLYEYQAAVENRDAAQQRIREISTEIASIQKRLGTRARDMYRGGAASVVDLLLGAASFNEFTTNWDLLNRLNENDADMSAQAKELRDEAEKQRATYSEQAEIASSKSEDAATAYADAQAIVEQMQATYESLSEEARVLYAQEAAAAEAARQAAIAAERERQAAAYAAAAAAAAAEGGYEGTTDYYTGSSETGTYVGGGTENGGAAYGGGVAGGIYANSPDDLSATGNEIVDRAISALGSDYVWGGVGGSAGGFDCSGLVSYALTGTNTRVGTTATFASWDQVSDPQPGDIAVIHEEGGSQHTGIYVGDGKMIHASTEGVGVVESDVQAGMIFVRP